MSFFLCFLFLWLLFLFNKMSFVKGIHDNWSICFFTLRRRRSVMFTTWTITFKTETKISNFTMKLSLFTHRFLFWFTFIFYDFHIFENIPRSSTIINVIYLFWRCLTFAIKYLFLSINLIHIWWFFISKSIVQRGA